MFRKNPFIALIAGLLLGTLLSSFATAGEISPDDLARELGLPVKDGDPFGSNFGFSKDIPQTRVVPPENFKDFRVTVDIFRISSKNPVLGLFSENDVDALVPDAGEMTPEERTAEAEKRFKLLKKREFAVLSVDGVPKKAYLISAAVEKEVEVIVRDANGDPVIDPATGKPMTKLSYKLTPSGNFRLDPLAYDKKLKRADGTVAKSVVAFPWLRSQSYGNSQMFWGFWIKGGYFIHSTPHYGELGRPASMGCIRQSFPDAQELFKLLVEDDLPGMIRLHAIGADESVSRLNELTSVPSKDRNWILGQLYGNYRKIRETIQYYGSELEIVGHAWLSENRTPSEVTWPNCGQFENNPVDCFTTWLVKKPKNP